MTIYMCCPECDLDKIDWIVAKDKEECKQKLFEIIKYVPMEDIEEQWNIISVPQEFIWQLDKKEVSIETLARLNRRST